LPLVWGLPWRGVSLSPWPSRRSTGPRGRCEFRCSSAERTPQQCRRVWGSPGGRIAFTRGAGRRDGIAGRCACDRASGWSPRPAAPACVARGSSRRLRERSFRSPCAPVRAAVCAARCLPGTRPGLPTAAAAPTECPSASENGGSIWSSASDAGGKGGADIHVEMAAGQQVRRTRCLLLVGDEDPGSPLGLPEAFGEARDRGVELIDALVGPGG